MPRLVDFEVVQQRLEAFGVDAVGCGRRYRLDKRLQHACVHRVGQLGQGVEVVVRHGVLGFDGAAGAGQAVAALDPAGGDTQLFGNANVVVLALRHVQVVGLLVAPGAFKAATGIGKVTGIGLFAQGVVAGQQQVKGRTQRLLEVLQRPGLGIGHGDQLEVLAQPGQRFDGIGEGGPLRDRVAKALGQRIAVGQAQLGGDHVPAAHQVVGVPVGVGAFAGSAVSGQKLLVGHVAARHGVAQVGKHAALKVDQGSNHIKRQHFEITQGHGGFLKSALGALQAGCSGGEIRCQA